LLDGNHRYVANRPAMNDSLTQRRIEVAQGQKPFATILGCVDSRVPPEVIFDQSLGDLFVIRTAAQVLDRAVLGSLEFGVENLNIPVIVVLGHEFCGAVKAALNIDGDTGKTGGHIDYLVEALAPAVAQGKRLGGDPWDQSGLAQVALQVEQLRRSPVLQAAARGGKLRVIGAWYSLTTGLVEITVE